MKIEKDKQKQIDDAFERLSKAFTKMRSYAAKLEVRSVKSSQHAYMESVQQKLKQTYIKQ